jgi:cell division protein FtsZ
VQAFDLNAEKAVADSEEGVVLGIETMWAPEAVVPVASRVDGDVEVGKNLDVSFEIVSPVKDVDFTAYFSKLQIKELLKASRETR